MDWIKIELDLGVTVTAVLLEVELVGPCISVLMLERELEVDLGVTESVNELFVGDCAFNATFFTIIEAGAQF